MAEKKQFFRKSLLSENVNFSVIFHDLHNEFQNFFINNIDKSDDIHKKFQIYWTSKRVPKDMNLVSLLKITG
jgi:hypothetical protein